MTGSGRQDVASDQPDLPAGGIRLLAFRQDGETAWLSLDSGEDLEIARGSLPAGLPAAGGILPPDLLAHLRLAAQRKQVARRALALLERRLLPVARLRSKLLEQGFAHEAIDAVLDQMAQQGFYSDRHYALAWCRDCLGSRCVGKLYLLARLRQQQVPAPVARSVVAELLDAEGEAELALRAARRRWERVQGPCDRRAEAKVVRFLQSRGFTGQLANQAAGRARPGSGRPEPQEDP